MIRGGYWGGAWGLSWAGTWGEAWLLLNQPYQELSLKGQVFVRSYLTRIHSVEAAERIVSVAALNNISVIDAEVVVAWATPQKQIKRQSKKKQVELSAKQSQSPVIAGRLDASIAAEAIQTNLIAHYNAMRVDLINCANQQIWSIKNGWKI